MIHQAIALLAVAACSAVSADTAPRYVATLPPLASIIGELTADRATVTALLPAGVSEHTYQPRPSDAVAVESANCLFYISDAMDGWAASLSAKKKVDVFRFLPADLRLAPLDGDDDHDTHGHGGEHASPNGDPHFWMDPLCVKAIVPALTQALIECDPDGRATYEANAKRFAAKLDEINTELAAKLKPLAGRAVVLFHPSLRYFLKRYSLKLAGVVELFPGKEPSPRYLQELIGKLKPLGAAAIFTEPQLPSRPAEVVAETTGLPLGTLDPVGGQKDRASYFDLLRFNARALRETLK